MNFQKHKNPLFVLLCLDDFLLLLFIREFSGAQESIVYSSVSFHAKHNNLSPCVMLIKNVFFIYVLLCVCCFLEWSLNVKCCNAN